MSLIERSSRTGFASVSLLAFLLIASPIHAQNPVESSRVDEELSDAESIRSPTIELGTFKINDLRPTRNETARLTFALHLAFSKSLTKRQLAYLESWKHRLRDQVITAVRISAMKDFQEPDLGLLRRRILIRVNRLLRTKVAEEVLLTEYRFRLH